MLPYVEHILADTKRRFDLGLTSLPEGEEHMIAPVRRIHEETKLEKFQPLQREVRLLAAVIGATKRIRLPGYVKYYEYNITFL